MSKQEFLCPEALADFAEAIAGKGVSLAVKGELAIVMRGVRPVVVMERIGDAVMAHIIATGERYWVTVEAGIMRVGAEA